MKSFQAFALILIFSFNLFGQAQSEKWYNAAERHNDHKAPVKDATRQKTTTMVTTDSSHNGLEPSNILAMIGTPKKREQSNDYSLLLIEFKN